jgi:hypothetical protein
MQERRSKNIPTSHERRGQPRALKPKLKGMPTGSHNPATSEVQYTDAEQEFMQAVERYKKERKRPFPTWREVLWIAKSLGYRLVAENTLEALLNGTSAPGRSTPD